MTCRFISIIIPCLNERDHIIGTISYLKEHIDDQCEIIVIDGGSKDDTWSIIQEINDIKCFSSSRTSRASQMNLGVQKSKGDVFYFLHADSMPPANFVEIIRNQLNTTADMGNFSVRFEPSFPLLKINEWVTRQPMLYRGGGDQSLFIKKDVFHALNGFDERYVIMEEYDFFRRARKQFKIKLVTNNAVTTSSRKYQYNNYFKIQLANLYIMTLYKLGAPPDYLRNKYRSILK